MRRWRLTAALMAALLVPSLSQAEPELVVPPMPRQVLLDPDHSSFGFQIRTRFGQHIEGVFPKIEGRILVLADGRHQVHLQLDARAVMIPDRERYTGWMRGEDFFDVAEYPSVQFDSLPYPADITREGGDILGNLTIRGVSHLELLRVEPAECTRAGYDCDVMARGSVSRGRYGMDKWQVALGEKVYLTMHARLLQTSAP